MSTTSLTTTEKRILIAKVCDWKFIEHNREPNGYVHLWEIKNPKGITTGSINGERERPKSKTGKRITEWHEQQEYYADKAGIPLYFTDLNACHEMEKAITAPHTLPLYHYSLMETCNPDADRLAKDWTPEQYGAAMQASATQRATAFGKALNLWP